LELPKLTPKGHNKKIREIEKGTLSRDPSKRQNRRTGTKCSKQKKITNM